MEEASLSFSHHQSSPLIISQLDHRHPLLLEALFYEYSRIHFQHC
jgi:hypothetical protein